MTKSEPGNAKLSAATRAASKGGFLQRLSARRRAPFQRDRYRFPHSYIVPRIFIDVVALPLSPIGYNAWQWTAGGLVMGTTVGLMWPTGPSADVRIQTWVERRESKVLKHSLLKVSTVGAAIATVGLLGAGWVVTAVTRDRQVWELTSLLTESLGLTHFYHVSLKLLLGREGPHQRAGLGVVHGPSFEFFPAGTPSGHAANVAAILGTFAEYYDRWWLRAGAFAVTTYFSASLVYHRQHYLSDVIWGAGLGYSTAQWVVRNRSTHYSSTPDGPRRVEQTDRSESMRLVESTGRFRSVLLPFATPRAAGLLWMSQF